MRHTLLFFLLLINISYAQKAENVFVRKYTQKDGISSYNIRRITEDRFGFLWIATQDGLSRFDGKSFVSYSTNAAPGHKLYGVDIREVIADTKENLLWVLPGETGINVINTVTSLVVKNIPIPGLGIEDWTTCMLKDEDHLWVGTFTGVKFYSIKENKFEALPVLKGNTANPVEFEVRSILKDSNGNIWVCYSGFGIVVYNGSNRKIITHIGLSLLNDHLKSNRMRFLKCIELHDQAIVFATNQGLRKITYNNLYSVQINNQPCKAYPKLNTESIQYLSKNSEDEILVSGYDGLFRFDTALTTYTVLEELSKTAKSDWLGTVQSIYIDSKNNTWLACQEGLGFLYNKKSPFESYAYDKVSNIKLDHVRTVYPMPDGSIFAGLQNGIVHIGSKSHIYTRYDQEHVYQHIFQDKNNKTIVSRPDGMFVFSDGTLTPIANVYPEFSSFSAISINSHIFLNNSTIVLGTESSSGILIWDFVQKKVRQIKKGTGKSMLSSNIVNNIYLDSKNNLWVLSDHVISILSDHFTKNTKLIPKETHTNLPYKLFFDMCEAGGYYWIASYGSGLLQLDSALHVREVINFGRGLSNDGVYQLYNILDKYLLVTSNNGMSLLDLHTLQCRDYYNSDGLHSNSFEEVCGLQKNGKIYAGGLNGFTIVDPSRFSTNTTPPVFYFTNIKAELKGQTLDTSDLRMQTLTIPNNWLRTNISFTGLNYSKPESVFYRYRIKEQDTSWINIGAQNFISLIGLPPGSYNVEVKASNEDGYWCKPVKLLLVFEPKWYETLLFEICTILAISFILYAFYRFRINQIRKQQEIRHGIANDLHDDIGSTLNSVKVFVHLVRRDANKEEHLNQIEDSLTQATTGLRDMIWVLDDTQDNLEELAERINKFAVPVTGAKDILFEYKMDPEISQFNISKTEKRNLLLIAKEAINNSIKYADCDSIYLEIKLVNGKIFMSISDNGKGFDLVNSTKGNGLNNISYRAKQIKYSAKINSSSDGTFITIEKNDTNFRKNYNSPNPTA